MSLPVRTENIQVGRSISNLQKLLWELPFYRVQNGIEGCFPALTNASSLYNAHKEVQKHLTQDKANIPVLEVLREQGIKYGAGWSTQTAFDILEGQNVQFPIPVEVVDLYGASATAESTNGRRLDYIIPMSENAVCIPFCIEGNRQSQLGDLTITLPKGDMRPELAMFTHKIMGLYAGLNSIANRVGQITGQKNIHPQEMRAMVDAIAEGQYIPTLREFTSTINSLMNAASVRVQDGVFTPLSGEDQLSMRYVNSMLVAQALLLFPWKTVKEPSTLPSDMIQKIHTISQNPHPEWGHYLSVDECQILAKQNIHLGHTFEEQLYQGVKQRIGARFNAIEQSGKSHHDALMPLVIEVGENGLRTDPESIRKANALIWSALNSVCKDLGVPFERSMWWNFHPDVDNGLFIVDINDTIYHGESVLAHEMRHLLEPKEQGRRFMVLDFFLDRINTRRQTQLTWATVTAISDKNRTDGATIESFLAPLYPSQTDIEYALALDAEKAMDILRQKPYYYLLTPYYKNLVDQRYETAWEWVGRVLNSAQDSLMGQDNEGYLDEKKIKYRKYPWEDKLDMSTPISMDVSVSITF